MDKPQLAEFVKSLLPDSEIKLGKNYTEITVASADLFAAAKTLYDNKETSCDFLVDITGVDYATDMAVIYHLESTKHRHMIVLKTRTAGRDNPVVDSVCDIWKTAELHEREVYDLLGIKFNNHPDLRRLFLDSSWGFPLRKDYVDDINIVSK
ncbi:MAG: NADH-quinone oxidoreductase subunit C [Bacteroidales bacterium]|jgi:NADH:ubiquinone oxidoreductase subunit C